MFRKYHPPRLAEIRQDSALSTFVAPLIANLAGYGGPLAIVIGAAQAGHASAEQITSMLCVIALTVGMASVLLSYLTRTPIITAWSTPGAAFLLTALPTVTYAEAIAGFIIANGIIFGMLSFTIIKLLSGKTKDVSITMYVLSIFFLIKIVLDASNAFAH